MKQNKLILLTIAVAGTATLAGAATVSYTGIDTGSQQTNNQTTINIPQFDPSLGSLQSVDFTLQGLADIQFTLTNSSLTQNMTYGINAQVQVALEDPSCAPNCTIGQDLVVTLPASFYPTTYVGTVGSESLLTPGSSTGPQELFPQSSVTDPGAISCGTDASLCATVTGTSTVADMVDMNDSTQLNASGGQKSFTENASGEGIVTVTYTYSPAGLGATPEPVSFYLLGSGLAGIALFAKKRRSKRQ